MEKNPISHESATFMLLPFHSHSVDFLQKIQECIRQNISNEYFGIKDLAYEVHLSASQLNRKLKSNGLPSAAKYILQFRMEYAAYLLLMHKDSIAAIGEYVGYKDPAHFCRSFKRFFNCSPRTYRKIKHLEFQKNLDKEVDAQNWQKNAQN